ncbi:MAG: hypothetical protein WC827_02905 [Candidatus Paceibacterota bacterium]|jgi:uncharacterized membrane protein YciS (DUF1049 family)
MSNIIQSQIFFFVSSIGFIILWILFGIIMIYILCIIKSFSKILKRAEKDIDSIGDTTKEILEEVLDSNVFRFVFKGKIRKNIKK